MKGNRIITYIYRRIYYCKMRKYHVNISMNAVVTTDCLFEGYNVVHKGAFIENCEIGKGTYIHTDCIFRNSKIGRFCSIAPNVKVILGNHPTRTFVSTHPTLYSTKNIAGLSYSNVNLVEEYSFADHSKRYVQIGNDVWIGDSCMIINGCTIGNGAIVAAGAVVASDIPPYSIVGGVPAKVIRKRFNEQDIIFLENFKWWEKDDKWIKNHIEGFSDINKMRKIVNDEIHYG